MAPSRVVPMLCTANHCNRFTTMVVPRAVVPGTDGSAMDQWRKTLLCSTTGLAASETVQEHQPSCSDRRVVARPWAGLTHLCRQMQTVQAERPTTSLRTSSNL